MFGQLLPEIKFSCLCPDVEACITSLSMLKPRISSLSFSALSRSVLFCLSTEFLISKRMPNKGFIGTRCGCTGVTGNCGVSTIQVAFCSRAISWSASFASAFKVGLSPELCKLRMMFLSLILSWKTALKTSLCCSVSWLSEGCLRSWRRSARISEGDSLFTLV